MNRGHALLTGLLVGGLFLLARGSSAAEGPSRLYLPAAIHPRFVPPGLLFSTFLGGSDQDRVNGLAYDPAGNMVVVGTTWSEDYPTTPGAFDENFNGLGDVYLAKLSPAGDTLLYATYLGGDDEDLANDMAVDAAGNVTITGFTHSAKFPTTPGSYDPVKDAGADAFVVRFNAAGGLVYSTFLGGEFQDLASAVVVDGSGGAIVTGWTTSADFPTTPDAYDATLGGVLDAFVARLSPGGDALTYGSFLGGSGWDYGYVLALDASNNLYAVGNTTSADFPTTPGAFNQSYQGGGNYGDGFAVKFTPGGAAWLTAPIWVGMGMKSPPP